MQKEVSREEAAKILGVARATLENWASRKVGPNYRIRGRRAFYEIDVLQKWSDAHQLKEMSDE